MFWAPIAMAVAGSLLKGLGNRRQNKKRNKILQQAAALLSPGSVMGGAQQFNPWLWNAVKGQQGTTGYQQNLYNMAQNPGYIDPALKNAPLTLAARDANSRFNNMLSQIGRSGLEGGMGDAMAFASQASLTRDRSKILQDYALWREDKRRQDLDWITNMMNSTIGYSQNSMQGQAGILAGQMPGQNWMQTGGDMFGAAAGAMSGMNFGGGGAQQGLNSAPAGSMIGPGSQWSDTTKPFWGANPNFNSATMFQSYQQPINFGQQSLGGASGVQNWTGNVFGGNMPWSLKR